MKSTKKTYFIFWISLLVITLILFFTLPSICLFYDIDSLNALIDKVGALNGISVGGFSITKLPALIKSYYGVYVPNDFPNNNMPVKIWATFIFIIVMYIENLVIVSKTLDKIKKDDDTFFNIPIILQSVIIMIVTTFVSLLCVINNNFYYVLVIVVYIIVFIVSLLIFFSTNTVKEHIVSVEKENKSKKKFIDDLKTECEILLNKIKNDASNDKLKKFTEEVRYSISVSNEITQNVENKMLNIIDELKQKIDMDENVDISNDIDKLNKLLKERNMLAKSN